MYNNTMVRVRFAPSPTGEMHIGNLRTAAFNWIFAKQQNGKFFVRIEDTDQSRYSKEHEEKIFKILKEFNLDFDITEDNIGIENGCLKQSLRSDVYKKYAKTLYNNGFCFYCSCVEINDCNCEEKKLSSGVLRFKVPQNEIISFNDLILGESSINSTNLENFALLRTDGSPTYMLSVVIDDIETKISHIIRGVDHKTNTFKQILLYKALNMSIPIFAHLPMIIGDDNKKLSKRKGNASVEYFLNKGYVADAIFNKLLRLGWGKDNYEIISKNEIIKIFDFQDVKKSPAKFDEKKLNSFSSYYLKHNNYSIKACDFIKEHYSEYENNILIKGYEEIAKKSSTYVEMYEHIKFIKDLTLNDNISNDINSGFTNTLKVYFSELIELKKSKAVSKDIILQFTKEFVLNNNLNFKDFCAEIRFFLTKSNNSIDIFIILSIININ